MCRRWECLCTWAKTQKNTLRDMRRHPTASTSDGFAVQKRHLLRDRLRRPEEDNEPPLACLECLPFGVIAWARALLGEFAHHRYRYRFYYY